MLNAKGPGGESDVTFLGEFISRGRRWNAYSDGTALPVIAGGDGTGEPPTPPTPPTPPAPPADKTFTQAELNAIVAREKESAKATAAQDLATQLGVSVEDAKALIKTAQDAESAKLSEAEKREQAAQAAEQKAKDRESAAAVRERDASIRAALAQAGVSKDDMPDAKRLVDLPDGDLDDKKVDEAVEELKKRRPELFGGTNSGSNGGGGYTPPGAPTAPKPTTRMSDLRKQYREQRETSGAKAS